MRRFVLSVGGATIVAMLCISMRVNFLFGYSLGQTLERAEVFGWVSVISDFWKALGPNLHRRPLSREEMDGHCRLVNLGSVLTLLHHVRRRRSLIQDRSSRMGNRETIVMDYDEFTADARRLEEKRNGLRKHRPAAILRRRSMRSSCARLRALDVLQATVGEVAANCQHADQRTTDACAEVAQLREELAAVGWGLSSDK